jgi:hypothetical protein
MLVFGPFLFDSDEWFSNDNSVYGYYCNSSEHTIDNCPANKEIWFTKTFTAIPEAQKVLFTNKNESGHIIVDSIDGDCNVIDRNNWTCYGNYFTSKMIDGEYAITNGTKRIGGEYYSKWLWLIKGKIDAVKALFD